MRPVVLVHGYLAGASMMRPLRRRLRAAGHDVHLTPELSRGVTGDVRQHAAELDAAVERIRRTTGAPEVDVIGASQGGIVALWWATHGGWGRVGRLLALGAPFRGSPLAGLLSPLRLPTEGLAQLAPGSPLLEELASLPLERPVISVSMEGDRVCPPERCALPGMRAVVLRGGYGPMTHQLLMLDRAAADALHRALVAC